MSGRERNRGLFAPEWMDLWFTVAFCTLTVITVFTPVIRETPLRTVVGLVFMLFVPGYALVAALFPDQGEQPDTGGATLSGVDRAVVAFGTSILLVPLVGLALNYTPWGIRLVPVIVALVGLTFLLCGAAVIRRQALPPSQRFQVPTARVSELSTNPLQSRGWTNPWLNLLLVVSLLVAISSVVFVVAVPTQEEPYTQFYLMTENESGDLVADDYPTNFTEGSAKPLVVGVENYERQAVNYTVVVELQRVNTSGGEMHVVEVQRIDRFRMQLASNETRHSQRMVRPEMTGDNLRLQFLLYRGEPPSNPSQETAYRDVHLWISVAER